MNDIIFLTMEDILDLHTQSLAAFGGTDGIRDIGGLESAVYHPETEYNYTNCDLYGIAAAYAFHIAEAQAFLDGNKRTAIGAALLFLEAHGIGTNCEPRVLHGAMIAIAEKRLDKAGLAARFRELFG